MFRPKLCDPTLARCVDRFEIAGWWKNLGPAARAKIVLVTMVKFSIASRALGCSGRFSALSSPAFANDGRISGQTRGATRKHQLRPALAGLLCLLGLAHRDRTFARSHDGPILDPLRQQAGHCFASAELKSQHWKGRSKLVHP